MEGSIFQHKVTHDSTVGELLISPGMVSFLPSDQLHQVPVHIAWSNIDFKETKYSSADDPKNRVMVRFQRVAGGQALVFNFQGADLTAKRSALNRLREIVSDIRQSNGSLVNRMSRSAQHGHHSTHHHHHHHEHASNPQQHGLSLTPEDKALLLQKDKSLARSYQDLVVVNKFFGDDEFWLYHANIIPSVLSTLTFEASDRGRTTSMVGDMSKVNERNGTQFVNLTPQEKEHIFQMYPAVKMAFEREVGIDKTEPEFWIAYFKSEYFLRSSSRKRGLNQTSDIFSRCEEEIRSKEATAAKANNSKAQKVQRPLVDQSIDLTKTYEDFHPRENIFLGDEVESSSRSSAHQQGASHSGSVFKYNRHSEVLMRSSVDATNVHASIDSNAELDELNKVEGMEGYVPLVLHYSSSSSTSRPGIAHESDRHHRPTNSEKLTAASILSSIASVTPKHSEADQYYKLNEKIMELSQQSVVGTKDQLSKEFRLEMADMFTAIGDLLRIAYAIITREGRDKPTEGSVAAIKLSKLFSLLEEKQTFLVLKRNYFEKEQRTAEVEVLKELIGLVARAKANQNRYR